MKNSRDKPKPPEPNRPPSYCYWSVVDGEDRAMAQTMIRSARTVGVATDFHIWSPVPILGAITHRIRSFDKTHYLFKLRFLKERVRALAYDYFVWLDADNYFVRNPGDLLRVLGDSPAHAALESDLCGKGLIRTDWRGCPLPVLVHLMRSAGVQHASVFNVNGGFWIVRRDMVETFCDLALTFWKTAFQRGYLFTEEAPLAYAVQMLCRNPASHSLRRWPDVWVSDWRGVYCRRLPDGQSWSFRDYFTAELLPVDPAIVHAIASKQLMIDASACTPHRKRE